MTELVTVQKWLQTFIVDPGSDEEALLSAEDAAGLGPNSAENMILPSPTLQPAERIQIYRNMYLLRMEEALSIDFPAVQHFLGERRFFRLVKDYVQAYPSRSYTLDHLGRHFARYLGERSQEIEHGPFLHDLARIEWSLCLAFQAANAPSIAMTDLANVDPADFESLVLKPIPSMELLQLEHNANEYYRSWVKDEETPTPAREDDWLIVWRDSTEFHRWRLSISEAGYHFLGLLCQEKTLGESLESTIERFSVSEAAAFEWFSEWVSEGLFSTYTFA